MTKKYILKPGKHQFAPGSAAVHDNDSLTDAELEWYMERYPHIISLFAPQAPEGGVEKDEQEIEKPNNKKIKGVGSLTSPSGGEGGL
ncbi:hypothetical protein [Mucilaginibacter sp. OK268]|uniref:hypothetical protein n=1 Tax=Mucilaginibacter sp. OK268 TaxID=1881048 RepID=UPI00115F7BC7|nr:hypothetical protein [Mucilaginibacter sp. OK268]